MTATEVLERRIDELCAEVERLRERLDTAGHNQTRNAREYARMCHENDSLRELVRALYYCTTSGECDECPVNGGGAVHLMPDTICDTMHDRMRELGVEP